MGTTRSMSVTAASSSQASSTESMSAMSAMEQPALRSGRITCWWSAVRMSADSAMKWTPQNTMNSAAGVGRQPRQPEGVAPGVGPAHDLVPLVVVAEDEQPIAERGLGRADPRRPARPGWPPCSARERRLEPEHVKLTSAGGAPIVAGGDSLVASSTGLSASEPICRRIPGRRCLQSYAVPPYVRRTPVCAIGRWPCSSGRRPARSPTRPGPTSSRTGTAASSTSARPSRSGRGCRTTS